MNIENNDVLRNWLREHGYAALAELPSFDVAEEEYERHLLEVRAQHLHDDEGSNQARAVYRCLTTHLGAPEKRPAAQDSMAAHLDRAARVFNQSVAVLAGKTEAHAAAIDAARTDILNAAAGDAKVVLDSVVGLHNRMEEQFHLQRSGVETLMAVDHATQHLVERRWRQMLWVVVLGFALVLGLLGFSVVARGQEKPSKPSVSLVVPDSYKLRIRDVQYAKDKVLIRLQNLQLQAQKAQQEADAKDKTINEIVYQLAVESHVDLSKWVLDLDSLSWQPKEK